MTLSDVGSHWARCSGGAIRQNQQDNISLLAAGVAFFGFLALFPALIALVTLVGWWRIPSRSPG